MGKPFSENDVGGYYQQNPRNEFERKVQDISLAAYLITTDLVNLLSRL